MGVTNGCHRNKFIGGKGEPYIMSLPSFKYVALSVSEIKQINTRCKSWKYVHALLHYTSVKILLVLTSSLDGSLNPTNIAQEAEGNNYFTRDEIMLLVTSVYLVNTSRHRLSTSCYQYHEWSNSVGKKLFFPPVSGSRTPHYGLWVSFSTGGNTHQPGSCHLSIQEANRTTQSRSSSSSTS